MNRFLRIAEALLFGLAVLMTIIVIGAAMPVAFGLGSKLARALGVGM